MSSAADAPPKPAPDPDVTTIRTTESGTEPDANETEIVREEQSEAGDVDEAESSIEVDVSTFGESNLASILIIVVC